MHLSAEGLEKIAAIKASLTRGLTPKLESAFSNVVLVDKPLVKNLPIPSPEWLSGFTSSEGCFYVKVFKSIQNKILYWI